MASQQGLQISGFFKADKATIEALTGVVEGTLGYASDDKHFGYYDGTAWVWSAGGGTPPDWGDIGGTLSDQTDLQTELDARLVGPQINAASAHTSGALHDNDKYVVLRNGNTVVVHSVTALTLSDMMASYLDGNLQPATHSHHAVDTPFAPTGGISATDVQTAVAEVDTEKVSHSLSTAADDFLVGSGSNTWIKKTLAQTVTILRTVLDGVFAPLSNGVTNGDSHDHNGGDGAQIAYGNLSGALTQAAGTYSPTCTAVANVDSTSAAADFVYLRIGNSVLVSGNLNVDATTVGVITTVRVSLPVASDLTAAGDLTGIGGIQGSDDVVIAQADTVNDAASVIYTPASAAATVVRILFMYPVK